MCESCERGFHTTCLDPPLETIPSGIWLCPGCLPGCAGQCGRGVDLDKMVFPGAHPDNPRHCSECATAVGLGLLCPVCHATYDADDYDVDMMFCEACEAWIHVECDAISPEAYHGPFAEDGVEYLCPGCRPPEFYPWWIESPLGPPPVQAPKRGLPPLKGKAKAPYYHSPRIARPLVLAISVSHKHPRKPKPKLNPKPAYVYVPPPLIAFPSVAALAPIPIIAAASVCAVEDVKPMDIVQKEPSTTAATPSTSILIQAPSTHALAPLPPTTTHPTSHTPSSTPPSPPSPTPPPSSASSTSTTSHPTKKFKPSPSTTTTAASPPPSCTLCSKSSPTPPTHATPLPLGRLIHTLGSFYAHATCILWSSGVTEADPGILRHVFPALRSAAKTHCSHCGETGSSLTCSYGSCRASFHLPCVYAAGGVMGIQSNPYARIVRCHKHAQKFPKHRKITLLSRDPDEPTPPDRAFVSDRSLIVAPYTVHRAQYARLFLDPSKPHADHLPIAAGIHTLLRLGHIVDAPGWYSRDTLYPLGYTALTGFWSVASPTSLDHYRCDIISSRNGSEWTASFLSPPHPDALLLNAGPASSASNPPPLIAAPGASNLQSPHLAQDMDELNQDPLAETPRPPPSRPQLPSVSGTPLFRISIRYSPQLLSALPGLSSGSSNSSNSSNRNSKPTWVPLVVASTPDKAWSVIINRINSLRTDANTRMAARSGLTPRERALSSDPFPYFETIARKVDGLGLFGLAHPTTIRYIETLPLAFLAEGYAFRFHTRNPAWKPSLYRLPAEPPAGAARLVPRGANRKVRSVAGVTPMETSNASASSSSSSSMTKSAMSSSSSNIPFAMLFRKLLASPPKLKIARSGIEGHGLYAEEDIPAGICVIEYRGEMIRSVVADVRERFYERTGLACYFFKIDDEHIIDATKKGNEARFINHSCVPNCSTKILNWNNTKKIVIYSIAFIPAGTELCYDYKFDRDSNPADRVPCYCGAARCTGWMT